MSSEPAAMGQPPSAEVQAAPPTGYPEPPAARTGNASVDAALDDLDRAAELPPAEQIGAYDAALGTLQEALSAIDENP